MMTTAPDQPDQPDQSGAEPTAEDIEAYAGAADLDPDESLVGDDSDQPASEPMPNTNTPKSQD